MFEIPLVSITKGDCLGTPLCEQYRNSPDVVLAAVRNTPHALVWASDELKNDSVFIMRCMEAQQGAEVLEYVSDELGDGNFEQILIESLIAHQSFHASGFLVAIGSTQSSSQSAQCKQECKLSLLNRGKETTNAITALIAQFAGVPATEHVDLCSRALELLDIEEETDASEESDFEENKL